MGFTFILARVIQERKMLGKTTPRTQDFNVAEIQMFDPG